mmetsp:Transcript_84952/g.155819  ORF Transcript_84952/g.155819 Transcript_84952/m.155819 type:complete len:190 (-) Transcript_84952:11-580(-)
MNMLQGKDTPDSGELRVGETVNMISVEQTREGLTDTNSVFEEVSEGSETVQLGSSSVNSRAYVSWFGFRSGDQQKKVGSLSGGERNRLQLAKKLKIGANVLMMDEPTNDLDVETMRSLEDALLDFAGCAVIVSHDRFFLDKLCTHILAAEGEAKWQWFNGNFQEYEEDRIRRMGDDIPKPIKYAPLVAT